MRNLLFKIAYNGTEYHGWQVQKNAITIQQRVQDSIEKLFGMRGNVVGCSRTDSGVHANAYYFNMLTEKQLPCENILRAMNTMLPHDISLLDCEEVALDFHARYQCVGKEYIYKIWNAQHENPFMHNMCYHYKFPLDLDKLNDAMEHFIGTHDFSSLCSIRSDVEDKVRTITEAHATQEGHLITLTFKGDGFLYNMVRIMVGTLIFVSEGKINADHIPNIIASHNREYAGKTAPARGLYLNSVFYEFAIKEALDERN